jgi:hypothetical protein
MKPEKSGPSGRTLEETLREETEKWLARLEKAYASFTPTGRLPDRELRPVRQNVEAYIRDARHFLRKGDLARAFEAVVYAWGLLEACQHLRLAKK